jgi:preprotein translocase subunit SecA
MPVHVVTVNNYLAERDAGQLRPVYEALGLTVGLVAFGQTPEERRDAYADDVTYCTNKDLVFDYLRDRLALGRLRGRPRQVIEALTNGSVQPRGQLLLRGLHAAIIDEADSVLIDEACTPLILAGTACGEEQSGAEIYPEALEMARALCEGSHWRIRQRERTASLTEAGRNELRRLAEGRAGLWASRRAREELAERIIGAASVSSRHAVHRRGWEDADC